MKNSMKKLLLMMVLLAFVAGCSKTPPDNLKPFRSKNATEIFQQGEKALTKKQYDKAIESFNALDTLYPYGPYAEQSLTDLIYAYYMKGDTASTLAMTDRYIRVYPRGKSIDYVYYIKGRTSEAEGLTWLQRKLNFDPAEHDLNTRKQAYVAYGQIVNLFPNSIYAHDAAIRMAQIRNLMAHKEVMLANFYLTEKAYDSAINRASIVVQHYNGSPEVIKALAILVKAYRGAGLNQMADNTLKILKANYPDSPEYKELVGTQPQKGWKKWVSKSKTKSETNS